MSVLTDRFNDTPCFSLCLYQHFGLRALQVSEILEIYILQNEIHPRSQPFPCLPDHVVNDWHRALVVRSSKILAVYIMRENVRADITIRFPCPFERTFRSIVYAHLFSVPVLPMEALRPGPCRKSLVIVSQPSMLIHNQSIPHAMQVRVPTVEHNRILVPTSIVILGVQRLMNVTEEMQHESQALTSLPQRETVVAHPLGMVRYRGDDTACFYGAISRDVDAALVRWGVVCIDVVPRFGVCEGGDIPDLIGEESCLGDVLAVEEIVRYVCCVGSEGEGCKVCDSAMTQGTPGESLGQEGNEREEEQHGERFGGGKGRRVGGGSSLYTFHMVGDAVK